MVLVIPAASTHVVVIDLELEGSYRGSNFQVIKDVLVLPHV